MTAQAALLPDGRLHLQQGPIDLLCRAWGETAAIQAAYRAAADLFPTILPALCAERPALARPLPSPAPRSPVARAMHAACAALAQPETHALTPQTLTPMAAVAGVVADHVLSAMVEAAPLTRAFVNNGGDIALHLAPGQCLRCGLVTRLAAPSLDGTLVLHATEPTRGLATSGRACKGQGGRSFSMGIADAVTILAATAAQADAAATLVANAVDLPGHPAITRRQAAALQPDSDLGDRLVTVAVGTLSPIEIARALTPGATVARRFRDHGTIAGAVLRLAGTTQVIDGDWRSAPSATKIARDSLGAGSMGGPN